MSVLLFAVATAQDSNETVGDSNLTGPGANVTEEVQKDLEIVLEKARCLGNSTIKGVIKLKLDSPVESAKTLTLEFDRKDYRKTMLEIINAMNLSFTELPPVINATNPGSSKAVYVETGAPAMLALKLPSGIDGVASVDMAVSGKSSNSLNAPYLDIGNDGRIDWYYVGDFKSWRPGYVKSNDLAETGSSTVILYDSPQQRLTYYCAWIDSPRTKDLRIFAKYKKMVDGGDIKAAVLTSVAPGDPLEVGGFGTVCDLPEQAVMQWNSCDVHLDYAAKGKLHVCVFAEVPGLSDATELYYLGVDAVEPATATSFNCNPDVDWGLCMPHEDGDYFIKVQAAEYESNLNKAVAFGDWYSYPDSFAAEIEGYVGTSGYDGGVYKEGVCMDRVCTVPVGIYGNGSGELTFSGLNLKYKSQGSTTVESTLYEIEQASPEIAVISGNDLGVTPVALEIPLSVFGEFRTSTPTFVFTDMGMEAKFGQDVAAVTIRVYRDEIPQSATEKLVGDTSNVLGNALGNKDTLRMLKILQLDAKFTEAKTKLDGYAVQLVERGDDVELVQEVEEFVQGLPRSVKLKKSLVDKFVAEPGDVKDAKSELSGEELYAFQFQADVLAQLKTYEIEYNSGELMTALMVVKKISPKASLGRVTVYEVIPKSVAESVDSVMFEQTPKIVNPDPVVSWYFPDLAPTEISYVVETDAEPNIYDFKTLIVPAEGEKEEEEELVCFCGDGFCEADCDEDEVGCPDDCKVEAKSNWLVFAVGGLAIVLVVLYILAFLNPNSFRKAALGSFPFKNPRQLDTLTRYIASAKSRGIPDSRIQAELRQSRWSSGQIKCAYDAIAVDRLLDPQIRSVPPKQESTKPMKQYMSAALARGMDIKAVTGCLLKAGWSRNQIAGAYLAAKLAIPIKLFFSKLGVRIK